MGLKVKNVSKCFVNKKAVQNVSFEIDKPGVFGLLGTNGAGKTTTIRMLLGILTKDSGEISWNGKDVKRKNVNFGYMPEERGVYPKTKIHDQLMYFAELKGMNKKEAEESMKKWAKRLEMEEYIEMSADKLSKGNQQKIQFMLAVMHNPELIILDEPFSGLDPVNTELLKNIILELVDEGKYIIMSSHQMTSIEEFCSDILILNKGATILQGNLKEIKENYPPSTLEIEVDKNIDEILNEFGFTNFNKVNNNYKISLKSEVSNENNNIITSDNSKILGNQTSENLLNKNFETDSLLKKLVNSNYKITKFELKKPSLNEIFIEKVGE